MKNLDYLTNYKTYIGKPIEIFPKIRSDGRKILSFAGFMQERINLEKSLANKDKFWHNKSYVTGDAIAYTPNLEAKILLDYEPNLKSRFIDGAEIISREQYETFDGIELTRDEVNSYGSVIPLRKEEVLKSPIFIDLSREHGLLRKFVNVVKPVYDEYGEQNTLHVQIESMLTKQDILDGKYFIRPLLIIKRGNSCIVFGLKTYDLNSKMVGIPKDTHLQK